VTFGGRWAITPALTLNAQATRFGWSEFDAIRLGARSTRRSRKTIATPGPLPPGSTRKWPQVDRARGIQRDVSPVRPDDRDARVPDANRWNFALGATHLMGKAIKIDVAANYITLDDAPINRVTAAYAGTAAQTPVLVDGTLSKAHVVVLSLGGRLAF
jgi:long-chain fatty acid transport protein